MAFFTGSGPFFGEASFMGIGPLHRLRAFPKRDSFTGICLLHRLWAISKMRQLHRHSPSSQALGLFQNATASQAFAFFTGAGPFPKLYSFTSVRLLHRRWAFSGVKPPEVLDVPRILDWHPLPSLQARGAGPGNMNNLERALPHGRELVQSLPGENPPEHEVPYLESSGRMLRQ